MEAKGNQKGAKLPSSTTLTSTVILKGKFTVILQRNPPKKSPSISKSNLKTSERTFIAKGKKGTSLSLKKKTGANISKNHTQQKAARRPKTKALDRCHQDWLLITR